MMQTDTALKCVVMMVCFLLGVAVGRAFLPAKPAVVTTEERTETTTTTGQVVRRVAIVPGTPTPGIPSSGSPEGRVLLPQVPGFGWAGGLPPGTVVMEEVTTSTATSNSSSSTHVEAPKPVAEARYSLGVVVVSPPVVSFVQDALGRGVSKEGFLVGPQVGARLGTSPLWVHASVLIPPASPVQASVGLSISWQF